MARRKTVVPEVVEEAPDVAGAEEETPPEVVEETGPEVVEEAVEPEVAEEPVEPEVAEEPVEAVEPEVVEEPVEAVEPEVVEEPVEAVEPAEPTEEIPDLTPPKSCINCGQDAVPIGVSVDKEGNVTYNCQLCRHEWTPEHEQSPFRKGYTSVNPGQDQYANWPET